MANKIDGFNQSQPLVTGGNKSGTASRADGTTQPAAAVSRHGDTVTLTDSARQLQKLAEAVAKAPVTSAERVQAVKDALSRDAFTVDAERVADKMLQFERDLG
jgi:negative regulator of flagellin synthesis FlgM